MDSERRSFSQSEIQMCPEYTWGSMAEKYVCGNESPEHPAEKHQQRELPTSSRVRPPLAIAFALFFLLPGENICELFEWNLILEII